MMIWVSKLNPSEFCSERDLLQRVDRVGAVAAVELREVGAQCCVLEAGEDAVADVLVERHAALPSGALDHDTGAEDRVGLAGEQWSEHLRQRFRRVLAVTVEHHHDVESVLDRDLVAGFLVAPVPEVGGLSDQGDGKIGHLLVAEADQVGGVLTVVVADDDLFDLRPDPVWDPVEHLGEGGGSVVRDHQDPDPLLVPTSSGNATFQPPTALHRRRALSDLYSLRARLGCCSVLPLLLSIARRCRKMAQPAVADTAYHQ